MICCESCKRQLTILDGEKSIPLGGWYELDIRHHGPYFTDYRIFSMENCETHLCPDCMEAVVKYIRNERQRS